MTDARKCYACDAEAITREHVPPQCFFPPGLRSNLETVPSCRRHNNDQSKDVEYVRNILVSLEVNDVGLGLWPKAQRSFERSPRLFDRTFRDARPIQTTKGETGVIRLDLPRFKEVMRGIARAVHYSRTPARQPDGWEVFSPSLASERSLRGQPDSWKGFRSLLGNLQFNSITTPVPRVFQCGMWTDNAGMVYRFTFYEGFVVCAFARLPSSARAAALVKAGQPMPHL